MNESNPIKSPKFKIGDKVEVDTKKGTIRHVSDFLGAYHVRTEKNGVILAYEENIKKLPKYAVGDVVRDKHDGKIYEVTMVLGSRTYHSGDVCFLEGAVEPFDGFRVGDTVWTLKRGKGVVNGMATWNKKDTRSYAVFFDRHGYKYPKNTNLIPTEAKYKYLVEASKKPTYTRTAEGKPELVDDENGEKKYYASKFAVNELVSYAGCIRAVVDAIHWKDGKFTYDLRTNCCPDGIPEDSLIAVTQPKFKVGDVVFYHSMASSNKKWVFLESIQGIARIRQIDDNGKERICHPNESDLRLWKETKFNYMLGSCVSIMPMSQIDMKSIRYMGKSVIPPDNIEYGDDVFLCKTTAGKDIILFGTKGDDIS